MSKDDFGAVTPATAPAGAAPRRLRHPARRRSAPQPAHPGGHRHLGRLRGRHRGQRRLRPQPREHLPQGLRRAGGAARHRRLREVARRLPRRAATRAGWTSCGPRWTPTPWSTAACAPSSPRPSSSTTGAAAATPSRWTGPSRPWPTSRGRSWPAPRRRPRTTSPSTPSPRAASPTATWSGCSRPRRWRRPTSSRRDRSTPPCPGPPTCTSPPASGRGRRSWPAPARPRTSSPTSSWPAATSWTATPRTCGASWAAGSRASTWPTPTPTRPRPSWPRASPASASRTRRACCRT